MADREHDPLSGSSVHTRDATREGRDTSTEFEPEGHPQVEQARRKGRGKAQELKEQGREAVEQAKEEAKERVDRGTSRAADRLESVVRALGAAAEELDFEGERWLGEYARQAASQVERVSVYLGDEDAPAMLRDLEDMARSHPGTFLGTAFAAGLAAGRFLRSSSPADRTDSEAGSGGPGEAVRSTGAEDASRDQDTGAPAGASASDGSSEEEAPSLVIDDEPTGPRGGHHGGL